MFEVKARLKVRDGELEEFIQQHAHGFQVRVSAVLDLVFEHRRVRVNSTQPFQEGDIEVGTRSPRARRRGLPMPKA